MVVSPICEETFMSNGITKTLPAERTQAEVDQLFEGAIGEYEFHMAGTPSKLAPGDYVYTIYHDQLIGRLQIARIEPGATNPKSGRPRTLIYVNTPGERIPQPIPRQGHQGTRYYDGADWPTTK
jgi:hypothetical protein